MTRIRSLLLVIFGLLTSLATDARADSARAYITFFQSGEVIAVDTVNGEVLRAIQVEDGAGIAAIAASATTGRLFVVDGNVESRLRVFDPTGVAVVGQQRFVNRALNFSDVGQLHMSRDGKWLFVHTYSYPDAANGVRIFDVERNAFVELGLRDRACPKPFLTSATNGSIFALCPGMVQAFAPEANIRGAFTVQVSATTAMGDAVAATATPDGRHVYAVGRSSPPDGPWRFMHWDRATGQLDTRDLAELVEVSRGSVASATRIWLGIPPDARTLVIVQDTSVWLIDRETLKPAASVRLPSRALGVDLSPSGANVLTIHVDSQDGSPRLVTTPLRGGGPQSTTIKGAVVARPSASLVVGAPN